MRYEEFNGPAIKPVQHYKTVMLRSTQKLDVRQENQLISRNVLAFGISAVLATVTVAAAKEMRSPLETLVVESDLIVTATLQKPKLLDPLSPSVKQWQAELEIHEVLFGKAQPGESVPLIWIEMAGVDCFNKHYERYEGERLLWLLVADENGRYGAPEVGRCLNLDAREKVEALLNQRPVESQGTAANTEK